MAIAPNKNKYAAMTAQGNKYLQAKANGTLGKQVAPTYQPPKTTVTKPVVQAPTKIYAKPIIAPNAGKPAAGGGGGGGSKGSAVTNVISAITGLKNNIKGSAGNGGKNAKSNGAPAVQRAVVQPPAAPVLSPAIMNKNNPIDTKYLKSVADNKKIAAEYTRPALNPAQERANALRKNAAAANTSLGKAFTTDASRVIQEQLTPIQSMKNVYAGKGGAADYVDIGASLIPGGIGKAGAGIGLGIIGSVAKGTAKGAAKGVAKEGVEIVADAIAKTAKGTAKGAKAVKPKDVVEVLDDGTKVTTRYADPPANFVPKPAPAQVVTKEADPIVQKVTEAVATLEKRQKMPVTEAQRGAIEDTVRRTNKKAETLTAKGASTTSKGPTPTKPPEPPIETPKPPTGASTAAKTADAPTPTKPPEPPTPPRPPEPPKIDPPITKVADTAAREAALKSGKKWLTKGNVVKGVVGTGIAGAVGMSMLGGDAAVEEVPAEVSAVDLLYGADGTTTDTAMQTSAETGYSGGSSYSGGGVGSSTYTGPVAGGMPGGQMTGGAISYGTRPDGSVPSVYYYDAEGNFQTAPVYIINGKAYLDAAGTTEVPAGSAVENPGFDPNNPNSGPEYWWKEQMDGQGVAQTQEGATNLLADWYTENFGDIETPEDLENLTIMEQIMEPYQGVIDSENARIDAETEAAITAMNEDLAARGIYNSDAAIGMADQIRQAGEAEKSALYASIASNAYEQYLQQKQAEEEMAYKQQALAQDQSQFSSTMEYNRAQDALANQWKQKDYDLDLYSATHKSSGKAAATPDSPQKIATSIAAYYMEGVANGTFSKQDAAMMAVSEALGEGLDRNLAASIETRIKSIVGL